MTCNEEINAARLGILAAAAEVRSFTDMGDGEIVGLLVALLLEEGIPDPEAGWHRPELYDRIRRELRE